MDQLKTAPAPEVGPPGQVAQDICIVSVNDMSL